MTTTTPISTNVPALRQREAFAAIQGELRALDADDLPRVNLDVRQAVMTVLGCTPELSTLAAELPTRLPEADPQLFTKMERYALALGHAQTQFIAASQPMEPIAELTEELREIVDRLATDAGGLAKRGFIDGERLALMAGTNGPKNTASSAFLLVELFRMNWSRITGKTPVTLAELDEAESLADRIETAVGVRDQGNPGAPDAALARNKAYALFVRAYDEVRHVVGYLRWKKGDADDFAPSLHAARGRRSTGSELRDAEPAAAEGQAANANASVGTGAGQNGVGAAAGVPGTQPKVTLPPGMPGDSPFIDE